MEKSVEQFYQELKDQEAARLENPEEAEYTFEVFEWVFGDGLH